MNADTLFIIKVVFGVIAASFTLSAAVFAFIDLSQNDKTENTQAWFKAKWEIVSSSRWRSLPETATRWLLNSRVFFSKLILRINANYLLMRVLAAFIPVLLFIACWIYWGKWMAFLSLIFSLTIVGFLNQSLTTFFDEYDVLQYLAVPLPFIALATVFLWLQIILNLDLYFAALIMIAFIPFFWITIFLPFLMLSGALKTDDTTDNLVSVFLVGIAGGFTITLLALSLGHLVEPSAHVPQTLQMLISNVMFDGLTMAITFAILDKALSKEGLLRLPLAIVLDIIVAGIFAVSSLYFGLIFTDKAIGLKGTFYILLARSADNSHFELSPYFWVMHTTFLPTLLYLSLILFCWLGKALLIPVRWFFGKGQENKNPLRLTAALCGVFVAIFTALSVGAGFVHERVKELNQKPPVINENR